MGNFSDAYEIIITPYGSNNVTQFQYTINGMAPWTTTMDATIPIRILPTFAPPYNVKVIAMNEYGSSGESNLVTMSSPNKPVINASYAGQNGAYAINVTVVSNGSSITNYSYSMDGGSYQSAGTTNPIIIPYTIAGTSSHTFTVKATNAIGESPVSDPVEVVATVPDKPVITVSYASQVNGYLINVTSSPNGSAILYYGYSMDGGNYQYVEETPPFTIPFKTYGSLTSHTINIKAINGIGESPESDPFNIASTVPEKPVINVVCSGDQWTGTKYLINVVGSAYGSNIINYSYSMDGGSYQTVNIANPITVPYTNGTSHTFAVKAINAVGTSPASDVSPSLPAANQPVIYVTYGLQSETINSPGRYTINVLTVPNGFIPTNYAYSMDGGNYQIVGAANPILLPYMTPDNLSHAFLVYAINAQGTLTSDSDLSQSVIAYKYVDNGGHTYNPTPDRPNMGSITVFYVKDSYKILVTASTNSSSTAIKNYAYSMDGGSYKTVSAINPITVPYTGNNTSHYFKVKAINTVYGQYAESDVATSPLVYAPRAAVIGQTR